MDPKPKIAASDFFLHLGSIIVLYGMIGALLTLLFRVIDAAYPPIREAYQYYSHPSISFPVASVIVLFPLFVVMSILIQRTYAEDPLKKQLDVRRWLVYLTIFLAGAVAAGDLITVIYFFLDGQDMTTAFLLKALSVLLVAGTVLGYYYRELHDKIQPAERNVWRGAVALFIAGSIVAGFTVLGSPATQRSYRYDEQRLNHLQQIQGQIVSYWQAKEALPLDLAQMKDPLSYYDIPVDPETGANYEYKATGARSFELCATFDLNPRSSSSAMSIARPYGFGPNDNWEYKEGRHCFERTIDPQIYAPMKRGL
ncbi:MAG TPA: DUF5671 domain-containing protein [Candidatus Paceibacterota bacterium]|nr:DUF5671 domain-containing protein [Candidatus Paceibacterota bacterium]